MKQWKIAVMRHAGRNVVCSNRRMTRLFYDLVGRCYDFLYHRLIRGYVESARALMDQVIDPGDEVLDVGCGTGLLSFLALTRAKRVVGVDLSFGMLQKGRRKRKATQPLFFVNGDALNLPFARQFDCCVTAFMLVMLPREARWRVVAGMKSLLKPGGRIAFLTSRPEMGDQWFSAKEWREGLAKLGLTGIQVTEDADVFMSIVAIKPDPESENSPSRGRVERTLEEYESGSPLHHPLPSLAP